MSLNLPTLYEVYAADQDDQAKLRALLEAVTGHAQKLASYNGHPEPEDAGQEIAVKVWRSLGSYNPKKAFSSWVSTVALNHLRDGARAAQRQPDMQAMDMIPEPGDSTPDGITVSLTKYTIRERKLLYWTAVDRDFEMTAERFGWTEQALRRRLQRIKVKYANAA